MTGHESLPPSVARGASEALGLGDETSLRVAERVGGGCIHPAVRVETDAGRPAFLKWSTRPGPAGFGIESRGLRALAERGGPPVPAVLGADGGDEGHGWLLLEWIEPGGTAAATDERFGRDLARLHRPLVDEPPGWGEEGWIATLRQPNPPTENWARFWATARIQPQWRMARDSGLFPASADSEMERLLSRMDEVVRGWERDGMSLLHGDLWSGNVLIGRQGVAHLVDPAVYRGHREVDLAMLELFGGFGPRARTAYLEAAPLSPGYEEVRRPLYQLYPLLVHVNLFGGGYVGRALAAMRAVLRAC